MKLDHLQVADLPATPTITVAETVPLRVVAQMVRTGELDAVLLTEHDEQVRGLIRGDAVLRLVERVPDAPVGMLPLHQVVAVKPSTKIVEAMHAFNPDVAALIIPQATGGWKIVTHERLESIGSFADLEAAHR